MSINRHITNVQRCEHRFQVPGAICKKTIRTAEYLGQVSDEKPNEMNGSPTQLLQQDFRTALQQYQKQLAKETTR
jgi:hypothetical protein